MKSFDVTGEDFISAMNRPDPTSTLLLAAAAGHAQTFDKYSETLDLLRKSREEVEICVKFIEGSQDPNDLLRFVRMVIDRGAKTSDALHEKVLRAQLEHDPFRMDLTATLVGLLLKKGDAPFPISRATEELAALPLDQLIDTALHEGAEGRVEQQYAALWQAIVQHRSSQRGWATFAVALAQNAHWQHARQAFKEALHYGAADEPASVEPLLEAVALLFAAEEVGDLDVASFVATLPSDLKHSPASVSVLVRLGDTRAKYAASIMLRSHADDWKASLVGAHTAFVRGDLDDSYNLIRRAFEQNTGETLREVVTVYSAQVDYVIAHLGKVEELADHVESLSRLTLIETLIPSTSSAAVVSQTRAIRQRALDRGLPSAFLVPHGKTASVSIGNIFSSGFALPTSVYSLLATSIIDPWLGEYMKGGSSYITHLNPSGRNVDLLVKHDVPNITVHVRDIRQLVISYVEHYKIFSEEIPSETRRLFSHYEDEALQFVIDNMAQHFVDWMVGWVEARSRIKVEFTHFEDFIKTPDAFVDRLIDLYGGDRKYFDSSVAFESHKYNHMRLGSVDEWKTRLSKKQIAAINEKIPSVLWDTFGWCE